MAAQRLHRRRQGGLDPEARSEAIKLLMERIDHFGWPAFIERLFASRSSSPVLGSICAKLELAAAKHLA